MCPFSLALACGFKSKLDRSNMISFFFDLSVIIALSYQHDYHHQEQMPRQSMHPEQHCLFHNNKKLQVSSCKVHYKRRPHKGEREVRGLRRTTCTATTAAFAFCGKGQQGRHLNTAAFVDHPTRGSLHHMTRRPCLS